MNQENTYNVQLVGPEEAAALTRRFGFGPAAEKVRRTLVLPGGLQLKGSFEMTARDVRTGEVAWQYEGENLITDYGRRVWQDVRINTAKISFTDTTENPLAARSAIACDPTQPVVSTTQTPTNDTFTHTKTFSTTFATPANNRTLGMIGLTPVAGTVNALAGLSSLTAYALLTPPKVQTTVQTLEVIYKISMIPIF